MFDVTLHLGLLFYDLKLVVNLVQIAFQQLFACEVSWSLQNVTSKIVTFSSLFSIYVMMSDRRTRSGLMLVDGCGSDYGCESFKQQKRIDSMDHEKIF